MSEPQEIAGTAYDQPSASLGGVSVEKLAHAIGVYLSSLRAPQPEQTKDEDRDAALRKTLPLLIEFTEKIKNIPQSFGIPVASRIDMQEQHAIRTFLNSAKKLAQFISQRINGISDITLRVELEIRLAEYEAVLSIANTIR